MLSEHQASSYTIKAVPKAAVPRLFFYLWNAKSYITLFDVIMLSFDDHTL